MSFSVKIFALFLVTFFIMRFVSVAQTEKDNFENLVRNDRSMVVPGKGGEGVLLGEESSAAEGRLTEKNFMVSRFRNKLDLYRDILNVELPFKIFFDKIIYFPDHKTVLLSFNGRINSIIGLNNRKITSDSIDLEKGIEYILFNYGNEHLLTLKNKNGTIYIYGKTGIAFVDDDSDNSLDMYILFAAEK